MKDRQRKLRGFRGLHLFVIVLSFSLYAADSLAAIADDVHARTQGRMEKFDSNGHPKAKGIHMTLKYPATWRAVEGDRPNIVQSFIGGNDAASAVYAILMIKEIPLIERLAMRLLSKDKLSEEVVSRMQAALGGATVLDAGQTNIEGEDATWGVLGGEFDRAGLKTEHRHIMFSVFYKGKWILFGGCVAGLPNDSTIEQRFNAYLPLFQQMANSIVLHDKWK